MVATDRRLGQFVAEDYGTQRRWLWPLRHPSARANFRHRDHL